VAQGRVDYLLNAEKPIVRLLVRDAPAAMQVLQSLPGVDEVRLNGGATVVVRGVSSQVVMDALVRSHIIPTEISTQTSDLESLFMEVTHDY
jgi:hypothetical protein